MTRGYLSVSSTTISQATGQNDVAPAHGHVAASDGGSLQPSGRIHSRAARARHRHASPGDSDCRCGRGRCLDMFQGQQGLEDSLHRRPQSHVRDTADRERRGGRRVPRDLHHVRQYRRRKPRCDLRHHGRAGVGESDGQSAGTRRRAAGRSRGARISRASLQRYRRSELALQRQVVL